MLPVVDVAARFEWKLDDPEIVSDMLLALANVWSIARTTYLMPAFEVLGPLQISLGRMLGDITRFLVLFTLVRSSRISLSFGVEVGSSFQVLQNKQKNIQSGDLNLGLY
jgi:hypothetical protein